MKKQNNKYAVIYVRQSAAELFDISDNIAEQERSCREYATEHGYQIIGIFRDVFYEAIEIDRVGFELMFDFIADAERTDAIITDSSDRFPEDLQKYGYAPDMLQNLGIKLLRANGLGE